MSSHNDTRHIIQGATGGTTDDTTAYNDVVAAGSQLTFTSINGDQKSVSVSGGGTAVQAYDSVSVSGNNIVFGKTDGSTADTQPLGGLTAITDLQTVTTGHTTDIDDLEAREQFKNVTQHPDVTDAQIGTLIHQNLPLIVNGRTYNFSHSSHNHTLQTSVLGAFRTSNGWQSEDNHVHRAYNTLVSGSYYDYSGLNSVGGTMGEWIKIQLPEAVVLSSFTMSADSTQSLPRRIH